LILEIDPKQDHNIGNKNKNIYVPL